jgi:hypothetical protein
MQTVITVILLRDGRHHLTVQCSLDDAIRWCENGYTVFRISADGNTWAFNHVNSGRVFGSEVGEVVPDKIELAGFLIHSKGKGIDQ